MPRGPRLDAPGAIHHVRLRGIARRRIFLDEEDRADFVSRLDRLVPELGFVCFAWALMPNHVHLVLRTGTTGLSQLMRRLGTGYAAHFNKRHRRIGHVFHNRFLSSLVDDDAYLKAAVAYVHKNPVEAQLVAFDALHTFPWCGHGAVVGTRPAYGFEAAAEALSLFEGDRRLATEAVGRSRLVRQPKEWRSRPAIRPARTSLPPECFDALLAEVTHEAGVLADQVLSSSRLHVVACARAAVAVRAAKELGMSLTDIAWRLRVSQPAVSQMLRRRY